MSNEIPLGKEEDAVLSVIHMWEYGWYRYHHDGIVMNFDTRPVRPVPRWLVQVTVSPESCEIDLNVWGAEFDEVMYFLERSGHVELKEAEPIGLSLGVYDLDDSRRIEIAVDDSGGVGKPGCDADVRTIVKINDRLWKSFRGGLDRLQKKQECCSLTRSGLQRVLFSSGDEPDRRYDGVLFAPSQLAMLFGVNEEALRKRLERFRGKYGDCFRQADSAVREEKYLYFLGKVRPQILDLKASGTHSNNKD